MHGLLERGDEVAAVARVIAAATSGRGEVLVLRANPGLGKSALLGLAAGEAAAAGLRVCSATCHELEQGYPFGLTLRLFEPATRELAADVRDDVFAGAASRARSLLEGGDADLRDLFGAIHGLYWFLANIAEAGPVLVVVDDLQWADTPSARLLHYLAGRVADLPVSIVCAVRDEKSLDADVVAIVDHPAVAVRDLAPLGQEAVTELVGDAAPEDLRRAAHRLTGGNPLLVQELLENLRVLREVGSDGGDGASVVLPSVASRLRRLPDAPQRLAAAVAVLDEAPLALGVRLAGIEPAAAHGAAGALVSAAILVTAEPPTFVHPLVRSSILDGLDRGTFVRLHADAAVLLDEQGAAPELVAPHLVEADPAADARRVDVLRRAARRATRTGGAGHAVRWLRRALAEGAPGDVTSLLFDLARSEALAEEPAWRERVENALTRSTSPADSARELLRLARVLHGAGDARAAADLSWRGVELLAGDRSDLALQLLGTYALASQVDVETRHGALARLETSIAAHPIGDDPAGRGLLGHLAYESAIAGGSAGASAVDEVVTLARRALGAVRGRPAHVSSMLLPAVLALQWCDELDVAEEALTVLYERGRADGDPIASASAANFRAPIAMLRCRPVEAAADAETAVKAFDIGWRLVTPGAAGNLALARLELDDVDGAERALRLPDDDQRWQHGASYTFWLFASASVAFAAGRADDGVAAMRECGRRQDLMGSWNPMVVPWRSTLALALARAGASVEPAALAEEELTLAKRFGAPRGIAVAERALAIIGPASQRVARLERSLELARRSPARIDVVRGEVELGVALRRQGAKAEAREVLRRALDAAEAGGAALLARRAREELGASGARPRVLALHGPAALTPSERRVADLAAQGRRNREIAEELFVSVKAVEFHLGNCFRKLGISARSDLGRALAG